MPPPNVTGSLHMGHALHCHARGRARSLAPHARLQHALAAGHRSRRHRHADRRRAQLEREGKTRHDLGREAFVERVWEWKARERRPHPRCSSACSARAPDWARTKFTMDPDLSRAVTEAFVRLLRGGAHLPRHAPHQLVPGVQTALCDLEVENEEGANGELFEFAYEVDGAAARSSSPRRAPRRCSATPPSPFTRTIRATRHSTARASCTRSSIGPSRSSPTRSSSTRSSAPAP